MQCIKEKCPKYYRSYGFYNCRLDNSCSRFELKECRADEFFQDLERDFVQLKCLYDLILKNQSEQSEALK